MRMYCDYCEGKREFEFLREEFDEESCNVVYEYYKCKECGYIHVKEVIM